MTDPAHGSFDREPGSFRDPAGFVYSRDGVLLRQVDLSFQDEFRQLADSGLLEELIRDGLLISHEEVDLSLAATDRAFRVLRPELIPFVSYPVEWCFNQLRAAADLTLEINTRALDRGFVLRDATPYNVQFIGSRPLWIDTLSFGPYHEGEPWLAYGQFCSSFLAPLRVASDLAPELLALGIRHLGGLPLDLASRLLPLRSWLRFSDLFHLHMHARSIRRHARDPDPEQVQRASLSWKGLTNLLEDLQDAVGSIRAPGGATTWGGYEGDHGYELDALEAKRRLVAEMATKESDAMVWDLGSNAGLFSAPLATPGRTVVSVDVDHGAVELAFRRSQEAESDHWLPLWVDLLSPTPGFGWGTEERHSLEARGPADLVLALALIHHLSLSGGVPLDRIARWFANIGRRILVEWVPASDPQALRLIAARREAPPGYSLEAFREAFGRHFRALREEPIPGSERTLFLLERLDQ